MLLKKKKKGKQHIKYSLSDNAATHAEMAVFQMFKHCSAWSKTWNSNNSVLTIFSLAREIRTTFHIHFTGKQLNLATCSTWHWASQRAPDNSCRPLTIARKNLFGLVLTEAQHSEEMLKGPSIVQLCTSHSLRMELICNISTCVGWRDVA